MLVCSGSSLAHQQKESYTSIKFNTKTDKLEITHRIKIHDAEHIIGRDADFLTTNSAIDLHQNINAQQRFADYVEKQFSLAGIDLRPLALASIGFEVDGKYFWVYQETDIPDGGVLYVKNSVFHEYWPEQVNHVNVEVDKRIYSARLNKRDQDKWRRVLAGPKAQPVSGKKSKL